MVYTFSLCTYLFYTFYSCSYYPGDIYLFYTFSLCSYYPRDIYLFYTFSLCYYYPRAIYLFYTFSLFSYYPRAGYLSYTFYLCSYYPRAGYLSYTFYSCSYYSRDIYLSYTLSLCSYYPRAIHQLWDNSSVLHLLPMFLLSQRFLSVLPFTYVLIIPRAIHPFYTFSLYSYYPRDISQLWDHSSVLHLLPVFLLFQRYLSVLHLSRFFRYFIPFLYNYSSFYLPSFLPPNPSLLVLLKHTLNTLTH